MYNGSTISKDNAPGAVGRTSFIVNGVVKKHDGLDELRQAANAVNVAAIRFGIKSDQWAEARQAHLELCDRMGFGNTGALTAEEVIERDVNQ